MFHVPGFIDGRLKVKYVTLLLEWLRYNLFLYFATVNLFFGQPSWN